MEKNRVKTIVAFLVIVCMVCSTTSVCYGLSKGKTSCPKTVKAGQYFDVTLTCPDISVEFDKEFKDAIRTRVYQCIQCNKWFYENELIDGKESITGVYVKICPECPEGTAVSGTIMPGGTEAKNLSGGSLSYGEGEQSWACTFKITSKYQKTITLKYSDYNTGDLVKLKKPGTYYLTGAFGVAESANLTTQTIDLDTRTIVDTGKVQYKKVRNKQYTHNTITVLGKVKFNANKGKVKSSSKWIKQKAKVGKLPKPTRKGYKFKGWYTKKKGGKKISSSTKVSFTGASKTYYAHWKKK